MIESAGDDSGIESEGRCLFVINHVFEKVFPRKGSLPHLGSQHFDCFMRDLVHVDDLG